MGIFIGSMLGWFIFRHLFGILLGALFGYLFLSPRSSRRYSYYNFFSGFTQERVNELQNMYFYTFFTLLGKMAKADGTITRQEGDYLLDLIKKLNLNGEYKSRAILYFNGAKNERKTVVELAQQFHLLCQNAPQLERQLLYQIVGMASVDGSISSQEDEIIQQIAHVFGISSAELSHIINSFEASTERSYHILGVNRNSSDDEIKRQYKKLIKECHPDILKNKGLPESMLEDAKKRFYEIQNAWTAIKKERNIV